MNSIFKIFHFIFKNDVSIVKTIYFNLHYFPFSDACRFPVIIYKKVVLAKMKGQIILDDLQIKSAMVHIGVKNFGFHSKHDDTIWEQSGGTVIIGFNVNIGKGTFIFVGENAVLRLERNVHIGGNDRIICMKSITIKAYTRLSWDVLVMDTDFHTTVNTISNKSNCHEKPIIIGENNWLCINSIILKGAITPDFCIVKVKAIIDNDFSKEGENIILAGGGDSMARVICRNIKGNFSDWTKQ